MDAGAIERQLSPTVVAEVRRVWVVRGYTSSMTIEGLRGSGWCGGVAWQSGRQRSHKRSCWMGWSYSASEGR
jgi:hypothetical protein